MSHPYIKRTTHPDTGTVITKLDIYFQDAHVNVFPDGTAEYVNECGESSIDWQYMDAEICRQTLRDVFAALAPTVRKGDKV